MRHALIASLLTTVVLVGCSKSSSETGAAPTPSDTPAAGVAETAATATPAAGSLTDMLSSKLGLSSDQAKAGVGAVLAYAEGALPATDFQKLSAAIPGAGDNIQAARDAGAVTDPITDVTGLNAAFSKLGISPEAGNQLISQVTDYVGKVAGPESANLLKGLFS